MEHTRKQAIEDGVLIDVTTTASEAGFRIPVALTAPAWAECVAVPEEVSGQDEAGSLWDVWMLHWKISHGSREASIVYYVAHVRNDDKISDPPPVTLKAVCGPDDDGSPCLTIMLPEEDKPGRAW